MKMLLNVRFPIEPFNTLVREGTVGKVIDEILEDIKPEVAYFSEQEGCRCGVFIVDVENPSRVPSLAEPFFLKFNAMCEFRIAMSPQDLTEAGLEGLGAKWG